VEAGDLEVVKVGRKADVAGVVDAGSWVVQGVLNEAVAGQADEEVPEEVAKEVAKVAAKEVEEEVEEDAAVTVRAEECKLDEDEEDRPSYHSKLPSKSLSEEIGCMGWGDKGFF